MTRNRCACDVCGLCAGMPAARSVSPARTRGLNTWQNSQKDNGERKYGEAMGAFNKFEQGVEHAVSNAFSKAFHSELKPVEIASALKKAMDEHSATIDRHRTVSPNVFKVSLSPEDYSNLLDWGEDEMREELAQSVLAYAQDQGITLLGPIDVTFLKSDGLTPGSLSVKSSARRGNVAPASAAQNAQEPMIQIGTSRYLLTGEITVLGRGSEADITIDDPGVSRKHLQLRLTPQGVIATDLGSTNGTFVEGHRVQAATLVDGNTIQIGHTSILFWEGTQGFDEAGRV